MIIIVPYPCGTIFSVLLVIMGILTLPGDPGAGIGMIFTGIFFLVINQAIIGSSRRRGSPTGLHNTSHHGRSQLGGIGEKPVLLCPKCDMEFTGTNSHMLCPNCQIPLERKFKTFSDAHAKPKAFYFENR